MKSIRTRSLVLKWNDLPVLHPYELVLIAPGKAVMQGGLLIMPCRPYHSTGLDVQLMKIQLPAAQVKRSMKVLNPNVKKVNADGEVYILFKKISAHNLRIIKMCNLHENQS